MAPQCKKKQQEIMAVVMDDCLIKKCSTLSLLEKIKLIMRVEADESITAVARFYGRNESTIRTIIKNKESIRKAVEEQSPRAGANVVRVRHDPYVAPVEKGTVHLDARL